MEASLKVLIADDHPLVLQGLRRALEESDGIEVVGEARSGDELLALVPDYKDRITFVHIDIYTSLESQKRKLAPTVQAYGLPSEPWLFGIDVSGIIRSRLDGAIGKDEIKAVLDQLVAT